MLSEQLEAQNCREEVRDTLLQSSCAQVDGYNGDGIRSALWGDQGRINALMWVLFRMQMRGLRLVFLNGYV